MSAHTRPTPFAITQTLLLSAATVILAFLFFVYIAYAINLMQFPFDYDQGEGFELVDTILFSQGRQPYLDADTYPFYASNYPPLYHLVAAPFVWFFGAEYWYGRLLGFLSSLVAAAAIAWAVERNTGHRWVALLAGLAFLASNTVYHIGPLFRQHMFMVMFEALAIVTLAGVNEISDTRRRRWLLLLGIALLLAAGYTKQLAAFTAVAAFAFLFIRQPRRAIVWGVGFGLAAGGIFLALNIITGGEWWNHVIRANINQYNLAQTIGLYRLWWALHGALIIPAVLLLVYELYFDRLSAYSIWFIAAVAVGAASGQWGAGDSYFSTAVAAMCILSGVFIGRTLRGGWHVPNNYLSRIFGYFRALRPAAGIFRAVLPLLFLLYGISVFHMPTEGGIFGELARLLNIQPNTQFAFYDSAGRIAGGYADIGHLTTEADIQAGWHIVELVSSSEGYAMTEDAGFSIRAGRDVIGNPTQLLNLAAAGLFDSSALIEMIQQRQFGIIIFRGQLYPVDVLQAIATHYSPDETIRMNGFDYIIMRPR
jgi:hypothetical protein